MEVDNGGQSGMTISTVLMELPAGKLLDRFGSGTHAPGSGSAAAMMGILSAKLIITVGKLSLKKGAVSARSLKD